MQCFHPVKLTLSDDERIRRVNNPKLPPVYRYSTFQYVPCGKCEACQSQKRASWFFRLKMEQEDSENCHFITLTYDDEKLPTKEIRYEDSTLPVGVVKKKDVQDFLKRLRERVRLPKELGYPGLRYFLVSEYGPQTLRPHYHMILFNFPSHLIHKIDELIFQSWGNGHISCSPISDARIAYLTSYCLDCSTIPKFLEKNFMLCSRRPAIGSSFLDRTSSINYLLDNKTDHIRLFKNGQMVTYRLPRLFRDKLFSQDFKDEIFSSYVEQHAEQYRELRNLQKDWLIEHNIEPNSITLNTAYDGSPLKQQADNIDGFIRNVQKQLKNKTL